MAQFEFKLSHYQGDVSYNPQGAEWCRQISSTSRTD